MNLHVCNHGNVGAALVGLLPTVENNPKEHVKLVFIFILIHQGNVGTALVDLLPTMENIPEEHVELVFIDYLSQRAGDLGLVT